MESREYTDEEVKEKFLNHVRLLVDYWDKVDETSTKEKLNGLAFSILSAIDGSAVDLPSFILAPLPHKTDKQFQIENGENYFPENHESEVNCDIAGGLHEHFYK